MYQYFLRYIVAPLYPYNNLPTHSPSLNRPGVEWRLRKHLERKASLMEGGSNAEGAGGGKGMWGRLLAKILDNVQVSQCFRVSYG